MKNNSHNLPIPRFELSTSGILTASALPQSIIPTTPFVHIFSSICTTHMPLFVGLREDSACLSQSLSLLLATIPIRRWMYLLKCSLHQSASINLPRIVVTYIINVWRVCLYCSNTKWHWHKPLGTAFNSKKYQRKYNELLQYFMVLYGIEHQRKLQSCTPIISKWLKISNNYHNLHSGECLT